MARLHHHNETRKRARRWVNTLKAISGGLPTPDGVPDLITAGISPQTWLDYATIQGCALRSRDAIMLHRAGISPALLDRWVTRCLSENPTMTTGYWWARITSQVQDLTSRNMPANLAGLYLLAGYTSPEAMTTHLAGKTTTCSLRVEAELGLPEPSILERPLVSYATSRP